MTSGAAKEGVAFMEGSKDPVSPTGKTNTTVKFLYEPDVSYAELDEAIWFEILVSPRVIGYGEIIRR